MQSHLVVVVVVVAFVFVSCGPDGELSASGTEPGGAPSDAGSSLVADAGKPFDAGQAFDAGRAFDAGQPDAGQPFDAGRPFDAGQPFDAGAPPAPRVCDLAPVNVPPSPDQTGLAAGPVFRLRSSVYYIRKPDGQLRDKVVINGRTQVFIGDVGFFDSTQKNSSLQVCQWASDPTYSVRDVGCGFERQSSSNPFLLKLLVVGPATATIVGTLDGVSSETPVVVEAH